MGKRYLIAIDMEGIHGVVGEPYKTATEAFDYGAALTGGALEANAVANALFDSGAEHVSVWANHGSPNNLDYAALDPRVEVIPRNTERIPHRYYFIPEGERYDGIILLGYHAREGTFGGVLAHTYSSVDIQYYMLNGKEIGEIEFDSYVAGVLYGTPTILVASDDACCAQAKETLTEVETVVTKYGKGRNKAEFIDEKAVLDELYRKTLVAVERRIAPLTLSFPCDFEIRFTRMERAEANLACYLERGICAAYGRDAHTIRLTFRDVEEMQFILFR